MQNINSIINTLNSLTVYRKILSDPVFNAYRLHLEALVNSDNMAHKIETYSNVYYQLALTCNPMTQIDAWQNHLLNLILNDDNPFSRAAFTPGIKYDVFYPAVQRDLSILQMAFELNATLVRDITMHHLNETSFLPDLMKQLPLWMGLPSIKNETIDANTRILSMKKNMSLATHWDKLATMLGDFYYTNGFGLYSCHIAFKWENGNLHGISQPDPITLDDLFGYEKIRKEIVKNTLQFLHGFPANNILLYGDRGTGKSSTVKALVNKYWSQGLRLIEVPKQALADFPYIVRKLTQKNHKYILFVDDLSFEEHETSYKVLKALLEGGIEARPKNVIIYATSNRRHLIKETFADREKVGNQEIKAMDSVQEKLSLADRFGLTVIFPTPDQELFLAIITELANQRGLPINSEDLRQRALQWSLWNNGRSPRSARQFIDHLEGQLQLDKLKN